MIKKINLIILSCISVFLFWEASVFAQCDAEPLYEFDVENFTYSKNKKCFKIDPTGGYSVEMQWVCIDSNGDVCGNGNPGQCGGAGCTVDEVLIWSSSSSVSGSQGGYSLVSLPLSDTYVPFVFLLAGYAFFLYRRKKQQQLT